MNSASATPWYRHRWPWLLMLGPGVVVVAGIYTTVLAFSSNDGLVSDDYYKEGLAINRTLKRDQQAVALGISAHVQFSPSRDAVRVILAGSGDQPAQLRLVMAHPTRAGLDHTVLLSRTAPGTYEARIDIARGPYLLQLEEPGGPWRVNGEWHEPMASVMLRPREEGRT